jgi:hypothetical protein
MQPRLQPEKEPLRNQAGDSLTMKVKPMKDFLVWNRKFRLAERILNVKTPFLLSVAASVRAGVCSVIFHEPFKRSLRIYPALSLFCGLFLGAFRLFGDEISLVRVGDVWTSCRGTNAPSSPITAWRACGFDDSAWSHKPSGFSTSYVVDFREPTLFLDAENYHSIYFRREFTVADPSLVKWLVLRADYDDGFVAYLNGQEVARRGLTNDPVQFDDYAEPHRGEAAEEFDITAAAGLLTAGTNLLAIEIHTALTNEPGNPNSMRLVPELLANFQRGPFIQNAATSSVQVIWRTPVNADSVVEFGTNQSLGIQVTNSTLTTNHVMTLSNLQPGGQYFYRVRSTSGGQSALSTISSFRTLKSSGDLSFLVVGDTGNGSLTQFQLANAMAQTEADLVMHCGDIVYPDFTYGLEDTRCLSVYRQQMRSVPFFFVMGNHEMQNGLLGTAYLETFYLPTNNVFGSEHFYSFDHGDAHFVALYMPHFVPAPEMDAYKLEEGSAQYSWLTNDLASSTKPWKFLFLHHPLATSGSHREDRNNGTVLFDWQILQNLLVPVAKRYGAQAIFSGHDHDYERFNPINGVQLIVAGAGSSELHGITDGRDVASSQFFSVPSFCKVTIAGDTLSLQAIATNGTVIDYMTMQRALPPTQLYQASWNSPVVETAPANDGHGNINGQCFNLIGTPIPTLPGDFSNLGRVFVNNDATNLYVGIDQPMLYSDANIYLFIETPTLTGVTNLIGLGNGVADTVEGVDGLDFLENLSFNSFTPSIACLLGDEFADGQFRNFNRPDSSLNVGQGVFRLDSAFSSVPGVRIQQFNRSPQVLDPNAGTFPERNANLIKVAIPFSQLGNLHPGDTIKIAAVVGLGGYNTSAQTRELDRSFLGSSMIGSGQSNVVLGALSVQLVPAQLTVIANDLARSYGAINPPLTFRYSGFVGGDDASVLSGSPILTTAADTNSPVGTYPIVLSSGTLSNAHYSFSFTNGTLTVTQSMLTVQAANQSRSYGTTNPPLTFSITGFVNGQNTNILSGSPNLSTTATSNSPPGSFPIVVAPGSLGVADTNYSFALVNGTMTITFVASATALVSSQNPAIYGDQVLLTATVNADPTLPFEPGGDVIFLANGASLGTGHLTNHIATLSTPSLSAGTNLVEAFYAGDGNFSASSNHLDQVVNIQCSSTNHILNIVCNETNTLTLTFAGTPKAQYYLLQTPDPTTPMANWTVLSTNRAEASVWSCTVTNQGGAKFFRLQAVAPCQ